MNSLEPWAWPMLTAPSVAGRELVKAMHARYAGRRPLPWSCEATTP